jgi:hypothetical protein
VVDVRVGQDHKIDRFDIESEIFVIHVAFDVAALEHSAIHKETLVLRFTQVVRSGNRFCGAEKCYLHVDTSVFAADFDVLILYQPGGQVNSA